MTEELQLLTLQACGRAVKSAAALAAEREAFRAEGALTRAVRQYELLQRELPPHARRLRLAAAAIERAAVAVQSAASGVSSEVLLSHVSAAERAAEAALSP